MSPAPVDLEAALAVAVECADLAAHVLATTALGAVRTKAHVADVVTDVDVATERAVRSHLAAAFPEHVVVGEELGGTPGAGPTWWCDPVDGTTNLAAGLPWTSFSLALSTGRQPLVGVVADPWRGEVLSAAAGRGAWRRRADGSTLPLAASGARTLAGAVVLTEWAAHLPWPGMLELVDALGRRGCTSRIMGSGTLSVASVGAGRCAGAVIGEFHPEDHLAAVLIATEAGALVGDRNGEQVVWPAGGPFTVSAPGVHRELHQLVQSS